MKYLLLLLLPAVAVGGEATYCTRLSDSSSYCLTSTPIEQDNSSVTERFEQREENNRDTFRSVQENLNRNTRFNHTHGNDLDE